MASDGESANTNWCVILLQFNWNVRKKSYDLLVLLGLMVELRASLTREGDIRLCSGRKNIEHHRWLLGQALAK